MEYVVYYFIGINILSFLIFGVDKAKATKNKWRIPEKYLFMITFFGGSIGSLLAMRQFRHKTQKSDFLSVIYLIIIIQILIISFVTYHYFKS